MRHTARDASPSMARGTFGGVSIARPLAAAMTIGATVIGMMSVLPSANATVAGAKAAAVTHVAAAALTPIAPVAQGPSAAALPVVAPVITGLSSFDLQLLDALNAHRVAAHLAPLVEAKGLDTLSTNWSTAMSGASTLQHNADAWDQLPTSGAKNRTAFGENVASWTDSTVTPTAVVDKYLTNVSNAANINDPALKYVGINTITAAGAKWNTVTLVDAVDAGSTYDPALRSIPVGQLTSAAITGATVRVTGWGLDADAASSAVTVSITDKAPDGTVSTATTAAGIAGTDIPDAFAAAGQQHDFAAVSKIAGRGVHQICATLTNIGAGTDTDLGCLPVQVSGMLGGVDNVSVAGTTVNVSGWSVDYDEPQSATNLTITDNGPSGTTTSTVRADQADSRVDGAIPGAGALHGFSKDLTATGAGAHSICVTQVSVDGSTTKNLGCRTVDVVVPVGALSATTNTVNSITVNGWVVDPSNASAPSSVQLTLTGPDGAVGAPVVVTANASATGSLAKYPTGGTSHGFTTTWKIPAVGNYQVCATALSLPGTTATTDLGCRAVAVTGLQGWLETVVVSRGAVVVRGWAMDSANVTATATATLTITPTTGSPVTVQAKADKARADVGRAFPGAGENHGYTASVVTGSGARTVCMTMTAMTNSTTRAVRCMSVIVP